MFAGSARLFLIQAASGDGAVGIGSGFHADVLLVLWTVMHFKSAIGHDCSAFLNLFKVKYIYAGVSSCYSAENDLRAFFLKRERV